MISQLSVAQLFFVTLLVGGYTRAVDVIDTSCVSTVVNQVQKNGEVSGVVYTQVVSSFLGQPVYIRDRSVQERHVSSLYQVSHSVNLLKGQRGKQSTAEFVHYPSLAPADDNDVAVVLPLSSQGLRDLGQFFGRVYPDLSKENVDLAVNSMAAQLNGGMVLKNELRVLRVSLKKDISGTVHVAESSPLFFTDILGNALFLEVSADKRCESSSTIHVQVGDAVGVVHGASSGLDMLRMLQEEIDVVASRVLEFSGHNKSDREHKTVDVRKWWSNMYGEMPKVDVDENVVSFLELHAEMNSNGNNNSNDNHSLGYEEDSITLFKDVVPFHLEVQHNDHKSLAVEWLTVKNDQVDSTNFLEHSMSVTEDPEGGEEEAPEEEAPYLHEYSGHSGPIGDANGEGMAHSSTGGDITKDENIISATGSPSVPGSPGAFDSCDMRTPMSNLFCPYPEPSQVVVNMASKMQTMALIGPSIDIAARDWNRGQDSPITVSEMILMELESKVQPTKNSAMETVFTVLKERIRGNNPSHSDPYAHIVEQYRARDYAVGKQRAIDVARNSMLNNGWKQEYVQGKPIYNRILPNRFVSNPSLLLKSFEMYNKDILRDPTLDDKLKQYIAKHTGSTYVPSNSTLAGSSFLSMEEALSTVQTPNYRETPDQIPDREKLIPSLKKNLFEKLVHPVTEALVEGITETCIMQGVPLVFDKTADIAKRYVPAGTAEALRAVLSTAVPMSVGLSTSDVVNRALPPYLIKTVTSGTVDTVTRAATHAMTYGLGMTLTHSPVVHYYCYYCKYWSHYCDECHDNLRVAGFNNVEYSYMYQAMYADHYTLMFRNFTLWEELQNDAFKP